MISPSAAHFPPQRVVSQSIEKCEKSKLPLIKQPHDLPTTSDDLMSPTSTVSSCRTSNGPVGQNTYNSTDSSGYNTSSTLDVAEHPELLKNNNLATNCLSRCSFKQQTFVSQAQVHAPKGNSIHSESLETQISNFAPSGKQSIPNTILETKTDLRSEQFNHSSKSPPVNVTSSLPLSGVPIAAPRARYPSSHTPPPASNHTPEAGSPWQPKNSSPVQNWHEANSQQVYSQRIYQPTNTSYNMSHVKSESTFSSEGRCRNPINAFDILPTDKVVLREKILEQGTLLLA